MTERSDHIAMSMNTDGQLVSLCRTGDLSAFEELVERHRRSIVLHACRRLGCFDDGEDIAQEAFVRAYFLMPQLRDRDRFLPWLRTIAERLCLMRLRSRREECVSPAELERLNPIAEPSEPLGDFLDTLPDAMGRAVSLTYFEGFTCAEAAEILGVQEGTVKSRLSRARAILKKELTIMGEPKSTSAFKNETTERLMRRAERLIEQGEYEAAGEQLEDVLDIQFERDMFLDPEAVRMAERAWEQSRQRDAEENARRYGRRLEDLDWKVARFNELSNSLAHPGGEGRDIWGMPADAWEHVLDARDICRRLKVSPATLHGWIGQGLPVIRYRPWVRFDLERVKAWLADRGTDSKPEISLREASHPLAYLFSAIEAGRITAEQAERIFRELDLPPV